MAVLAMACVPFRAGARRGRCGPGRSASGRQLEQSLKAIDQLTARVRELRVAHGRGTAGRSTGCRARDGRPASGTPAAGAADERIASSRVRLPR